MLSGGGIFRDAEWMVIPCWKSKRKGRCRIHANPSDVYVNTNIFYKVNARHLLLCEEMELKTKRETLMCIHDKHNEFAYKTGLRKKKLAKAKKRNKETEEGRKYEIAVINNDRRTMKELEDACGGDPRKLVGKCKGGKLSKVGNPKPMVGGRVSPK